ncbi:MAG: T9SS type A sorting domain-containing protein [Ignavibacteriae bacterium]|nr:T9SS type A sorting domain-containing protein [Ignavibacteriota bacterium]
MKHLATISAILFLVLISSTLLFSQASNYFPNSIGTTWTFDGVMLGAGDTVMTGSEYREIDSVAAYSTINGKNAYTIQSRLESGVPSGTSSFAFEGANAFVYLPTLPPPLDTMIDVPPPQWLLSFKFNSGFTPDWTIIEWDTTITFDTLTIPVAIRISGDRETLNDEVIVPAGTFTAARFNIIEQVGTTIFGPFIPFFTMVDTFWIAQNTWIVKHARSAVSVEIPATTDTISFTIPGVRRELVAFNPNAVNGEEDVPSGFALYQNYPNPFNPATNFEFRIANFEFVSLKVFNVLGQEVATLVNEMKSPGEHFVTWDASGLPSGVYYYRLTVGSYLQTKMLQIVK